MAESSPLTQPVVTRRQVIVIAVLGVILAVALIVQFGGASGKPEGEKGRKGEGENKSVASRPLPVSFSPPLPFSPSPATLPSPLPLGEGRVGAAPSPWPKLGADAAAQHDPFAMPAPLAKQTQPETPKKSEPPKPVRRDPATDPVLAGLRSKGTHAVFRDGDGAAAVIDNRVVHVGDVLQGYRVVSIDDDGVLVTPSGGQ